MVPDVFDRVGGAAPQPARLVAAADRPGAAAGMVTPSAAAPTLDDVLGHLHDRLGLAFPQARRADAQRGLDRALARSGIDGYGGLLVRMESDPSVFDAVVAELTVGETYFFREPAQFRMVRETILPDLLRTRAPARRLQVWSAGCATGEEAYSLAILLEQEGLAGQAEILGTDVSRRALDLARAGTYGKWSLRGEGTPDLDGFIRKQGNRYAVAPPLRDRVRFAPLNLATDTYPAVAAGIADLDLIFCRNVLIYFSQDVVRRVARRLYASLREDGWLVAGPSDPPLTDHAPFEVVSRPGVLVYRRSRLAADQAPARRLVRQAEPVRAPALRAGRTPQRVALPRPPPATPPASETQPPLPAGGTEAVARHIRGLADRGEVSAAAAAADDAAQQQPMEPAFHHLHGLCLAALGKAHEAIAAQRRALYLDQEMAVAHLALGSLLQEQGDRRGARRAFQNVRALCMAAAADQAVPLADGETAGRLAERAATHLRLLDRQAGSSQP